MDEERIYRLSHNKLIQELVKRNLPTNGIDFILKARLFHHDQGYNAQRFDFLAVIDFEATCAAKPPIPPNPYIQEIIEFPIVLIDVAQQKIVAQFHSYCQPVCQPILSDYCKQLTGITQEQVNKAPIFPDVFANVEKWLNENNLLTNSKRKCLFVTDSQSDFNKYLHMQCEISQIDYPKWGYQWINIKYAFTRFYSIRSGRIRDMLQKLGLPFVGNLHSGLDDATNIGRIAIELIKDGCVLTPNESYTPVQPISRRNISLSTNTSNSSRLVCLNCSQSHADIQGSCVQRKVHKRQRSRSPSHQLLPNQIKSATNIPSLLDLPVMHANNPPDSSQRFQSSRLFDTNNNMDTR